MTKHLQDDPTQWFPMPAVLISTRAENGAFNVMGIGYVGFCCWDPPMVTLGVNRARHTRTILHETREVVVNLPEPQHIVAMDYCGFVSGVSHDKFSTSGLIAVPGHRVAAPLISQCPVNLECVVRQIVPLGSHELFIAEVVATHVDGCLIDQSTPLTTVILQSRYYVSASERVSPFGISQGNPPEGLTRCSDETMA